MQDRQKSIQKDLSNIRAEVDKLDKEIAEKLLQRLKLSEKMGKLKKQMDQKIFLPEREKEIYINILEGLENKEKKYLQSIYERILDESRIHQIKQKKTQ